MGNNVTIALLHSDVWHSGNLMSIVMSPFTNIFGDLTYLLIGLIIFGAMWVKTEHAAPIAILGLIYAALVASVVPPESQTIIVLLVGLAAGTFVYRAFWRGGEQ